MDGVGWERVMKPEQSFGQGLQVSSQVRARGKWVDGIVHYAAEGPERA